MPTSRDVYAAFHRLYLLETFPSAIGPRGNFSAFYAMAEKTSPSVLPFFSSVRRPNMQSKRRISPLIASLKHWITAESHGEGKRWDREQGAFPLRRLRTMRCASAQRLERTTFAFVRSNSKCGWEDDRTPTKEPVRPVSLWACRGTGDEASGRLRDTVPGALRFATNLSSICVIWSCLAT